MRKLGISTEKEFFSETSIGLLSSSKPKFRDLDQYFGWVKLQESQTLVWPQARKTLNTKTAKFWYIHYIPRFKVQELKIAEAEDKILMYIVSKIQLHIHYIRGYMIPPSYGSSLF